jgi:hypothetical protein
LRRRRDPKEGRLQFLRQRPLPDLGEDVSRQPVLPVADGIRTGRDQVGQELAGRRAFRWILGQAPFEQRPQPGGNPAKVRGEVQHAQGARVGRARPEWKLARRRVREHGPHREDVAARPDRVALYQLGRDEPGGAQDRGRRCYLDEVRSLGDAEVDQPGPVFREQHVGRLKVTVDDARRVHRAEALSEARRQGEHGGERQRAVPGDRVAKRRAGHVVGDQPRHRRVRVGVDDRRGERAANPAGRLDLPGEPGPETLILRQVGADDLDRYVAPAKRPAEIDLAHAAGPEPREQGVIPDLPRIADLQLVQNRPRLVGTGRLSSEGDYSNKAPS